MLAMFVANIVIPITSSIVATNISFLPIGNICVNAIISSTSFVDTPYNFELKHN